MTRGANRRGPYGNGNKLSIDAVPASSGWTETGEGHIPHLRIVCSDGLVFEAPVVVTYGRKHNSTRAMPTRVGGKLVYALPGGGRVEG